MRLTDSFVSPMPIMHAALHIFEFWALAFVSLCATLVLLDIFWDLIEQDLCLQTLGKEAVIAGIASLIEAIGLWLILTFANSPLGMRGMIIPGLFVGVIYKIAHFEDWTRYEIICLLMFQLIVTTIGAGLLMAHFAMAITVAIIFAFILAVIAGFVRGL
jgi:hypothetical protein